MLRPGAPAPSGLEHARFVAVALTTDVAVLDYDAYQASPDVIRVHSAGRWPVQGFSLEDDLRQVEQHQVDHQAGRSFAYTLLAPSRAEALGCVYLNPLADYLARTGASPALAASFPVASAMVTFWLRQDQQETDLADVVVAALDAWLRDAWPLDRALFRVLPEEHASRAALERLGLGRLELELSGEPRPYLWFVARR